MERDNARITEIMGLSKENLAKKQHDVLQQHVIDILRQFVGALQKNDFEKAQSLIPANHLDFGYEEGMTLSIGDALNQIESLYIASNQEGGGVDEA